MDDVGAEVGLKMRSAIKAKLMELDCYVDDELPDYIMVMVANKRTKSQMKEDLTLFLNAKTTSFVDWLHIVLKKLKEVHVTNPEILKRSSKRKSDDSSEVARKIKKEKKGSKSTKSSKKINAAAEPAEEKSLTDDLPITASKLTEVRKIVVMQNNVTSNSTANKFDAINEDMFDIPLLSEVDNLSNKEELKLIQKRINSVKSRLGIQVQSSSEGEDDMGNKSIDDDVINLKSDPEDVISGDVSTSSLATISSHRKGATIVETAATSSTTDTHKRPDKSHTPPHPVNTSNHNNYIDSSLHKAATHTRIVFEDEHPRKKMQSARQITVDDELPTKKRSILERLGKRPAYDDLECRSSKIHSSNDKDKEDEVSRKRHRENEDRRNEDRRRESNRRGSRSHTSDHDKNKEDKTHRAGVKSKVSIPDLPAKSQVAVEEESDNELEKKVKRKGVASMVKVKPRVLPPVANQANKSLLLKAVAEAQRSVAQTPAVGSTKRDAVFTKGYKEKVLDQSRTRKISNKEKSALRNMLKAMVSGPLRKVTLEENDLEYVPKPIKEQPGAVNIHYKPSPLKQLSVTSETSSDAEMPTPTKPVDINFKQQFIVTLDGVDTQRFNQTNNVICKDEAPKRISPIIFDKNDTTNDPTIKDRSKIPDKLPLVTVPGLKSRERCKFWPNCKAGGKCDFHHPGITASASDSGLCKMFPSCKFGDKCVYVHPTCKFENSCTRRDCPYSHKSAVSRIVSTPSICKFHPKCSNIHCSFYHPMTKPCKFGKYCKNQPECIFSHLSASIVPKPTNLTWRPKT